MNYDEAFLLRWIEWNTINKDFISYVQSHVAAGKGSLDFRTAFNSMWAVLTSGTTRTQFTNMPSLDELAVKTGVRVPVISEAEMQASGETKMLYALKELENYVVTAASNVSLPTALFEQATPIAKEPTTYVDYLKLALKTLQLPEGVQVEEVRFYADKAKAQTFTLADAMTVSKDKKITLKKTAYTKYYKLVPGQPPVQIADWTVD